MVVSVSNAQLERPAWEAQADSWNKFTVAGHTAKLASTKDNGLLAEMYWEDTFNGGTSGSTCFFVFVPNVENPLKTKHIWLQYTYLMPADDMKAPWDVRPLVEDEYSVRETGRNLVYARDFNSPGLNIWTQALAWDVTPQPDYEVFVWDYIHDPTPGLISVEVGTFCDRQVPEPSTFGLVGMAALLCLIAGRARLRYLRRAQTSSSA